ncbi:MAG: stage V sporulation protein K, partial [Firmicutes bacterium]|nr:stage V sporulation protein K [Bacillota bacterium]
YTGHELVLIAKSIAASKDYRIDEEALKPLEDYFSKVQSRKDMTSGNGRLARNIVEEAILNQSKRVLEDDAEIDLLQLVDFDLKEGL